MRRRGGWRSFTLEGLGIEGYAIYQFRFRNFHLLVLIFQHSDVTFAGISHTHLSKVHKVKVMGNNI